MNTVFVRVYLALAVVATAGARPVVWSDLPPAVHARLQPGFTADNFDDKIAALAREAQARVREGDMDHLVFYVLQSTHFTTLPPIEPALSAREFVDASRAATTKARFPSAVDARVGAFLKAVDSRDPDPRLAYFRALLKESAAGRDRLGVLAAEYARAMTFLYEKEFVNRAPEAVAHLYQTRGDRKSVV